MRDPARASIDAAVDRCKLPKNEDDDKSNDGNQNICKESLHNQSDPLVPPKGYIAISTPAKLRTPYIDVE